MRKGKGRRKWTAEGGRQRKWKGREIDGREERRRGRVISPPRSFLKVGAL